MDPGRCDFRGFEALIVERKEIEKLAHLRRGDPSFRLPSSRPKHRQPGCVETLVSQGRDYFGEFLIAQRRRSRNYHRPRGHTFHGRDSIVHSKDFGKGLEGVINVIEVFRIHGAVKG